MLSQVMPGLIGSAASNPFGTIPSATTTAQGLMPLGLNFGKYLLFVLHILFLLRT